MNNKRQKRKNQKKKKKSEGTVLEEMWFSLCSLGSCGMLKPSGCFYTKHKFGNVS